MPYMLSAKTTVLEMNMRCQRIIIDQNSIGFAADRMIRPVACRLVPHVNHPIAGRVAIHPEFP